MERAPSADFLVNSLLSRCQLAEQDVVDFGRKILLVYLGRAPQDEFAGKAGQLHRSFASYLLYDFTQKSSKQVSLGSVVAKQRARPNKPSLLPRSLGPSSPKWVVQTHCETR